ncbi:unnamed protein product, partial [Didymodactylos carnosus]
DDLLDLYSVKINSKTQQSSFKIKIVENYLDIRQGRLKEVSIIGPCTNVEGESNIEILFSRPVAREEKCQNVQLAKTTLEKVELLPTQYRTQSVEQDDVRLPRKEFLSGGVKFGIAAAVVLLIAFVAGGVLVYLLKKRRQYQQQMGNSYAASLSSIFESDSPRKTMSDSI